MQGELKQNDPAKSQGRVDGAPLARGVVPRPAERPPVQVPGTPPVPTTPLPPATYQSPQPGAEPEFIDRYETKRPELLPHVSTGRPRSRLHEARERARAVIATKAEQRQNDASTAPSTVQLLRPSPAEASRAQLMAERFARNTIVRERLLDVCSAPALAVELGWALLALGKGEAAGWCFEAALAASEVSGEARLGLGVASIERERERARLGGRSPNDLGRVQKTVAMLEQATQAGPEVALRARYALAVSLGLLGRLDEALALVASVAALDVGLGAALAREAELTLP
jgi:tetratricopeptide (TPR) repeat protein